MPLPLLAALLPASKLNSVCTGADTEFAVEATNFQIRTVSSSRTSTVDPVEQACNETGHDDLINISKQRIGGLL